MTIADRVVKFLSEVDGASYCDDCIQKRLRLKD